MMGWFWLAAAMCVVVLMLLFVWSLCVVSARADVDHDRMFGTIVPPEKPRNTLPPRLPR